MHKTDNLKNPVIVFHCKNCGCTTKIRVASFENPDLDIPENNMIACYRCRAEVAGTELFLGKKQPKISLPWRYPMSIKIIQHKQNPKELAYHFKCGCGCEFWSDSEGVLVEKLLDVILFYQTQCPECGSRVESDDEPVLREEIFDD